MNPSDRLTEPSSRRLHRETLPFPSVPDNRIVSLGRTNKWYTKRKEESRVNGPSPGLPNFSTFDVYLGERQVLMRRPRPPLSHRVVSVEGLVGGDWDGLTFFERYCTTFTRPHATVHGSVSYTRPY